MGQKSAVDFTSRAYKKKYSQVGALELRLFYCEMFGVKSEGNLMPDALNQLVGSN